MVSDTLDVKEKHGIKDPVVEQLDKNNGNLLL